MYEIATLKTKKLPELQEIAKKLNKLINADPKMKAYLVRDSDYFIPLKKRVSKARKVKADIFISIHADAFRKRNVSGSSVFALSEKGATSAFAKFIANKEKKTFGEMLPSKKYKIDHRFQAFKKIKKFL